MSFECTRPDFDVCALKKSYQLNHPKTAKQNVSHPFQLLFVDLMGPISLRVLGGLQYVGKTSDEHTKWMEIYKSRGNALSSFQSFVQSMVIPSGSGVECLRVDTDGEYIRNEYKGYSIQTGVSLEYASNNTPQQTDMSERA